MLGLTQIRLFFAALVALIIIASLMTFGCHERHIELQTMEKSSVRVQKQADAGTEANVVKAAIAARGADDDQHAVDAYLAAHPIEPVRLCHEDDRGGGLPKARAPVAAPAHPGAGSAAVPSVLGGSDSGDAEGPDVSDALDTILRATETLDVLYRERQRR